MKEQVSEAIASCLSSLDLGLTDSQIIQAAAKTMDCKPEYGKITNPCVMELSKNLQLKPLVLAKQLADAVAVKLPDISVTVTGPGYLNFK